MVDAIGGVSVVTVLVTSLLWCGECGSNGGGEGWFREGGDG